MDDVSVTFRPPEDLLRSIQEDFARKDESVPVCDECLRESDNLKRCTRCKVGGIGSLL